MFHSLALFDLSRNILHVIKKIKINIDNLSEKKTTQSLKKKNNQPK